MNELARIAKDSRFLPVVDFFSGVPQSLLRESRIVGLDLSGVTTATELIRRVRQEFSEREWMVFEDVITTLSGHYRERKIPRQTFVEIVLTMALTKCRGGTSSLVGYDHDGGRWAKSGRRLADLIEQRGMLPRSLINEVLTGDKPRSATGARAVMNFDEVSTC